MLTMTIRVKSATFIGHSWQRMNISGVYYVEMDKSVSTFSFFGTVKIGTKKYTFVF